MKTIEFRESEISPIADKISKVITSEFNQRYPTDIIKVGFLIGTTAKDTERINDLRDFETQVLDYLIKK